MAYIFTNSDVSTNALTLTANTKATSEH